MSWLLIDTAIRAAAAAVVLVLGLSIWRDGQNRLAARLTGLLCLAIIGHLVNVALIMPQGGHAFDLPVELLSLAVPPMFWLVALAVFVDGYRLRAAHLAIFAGYLLYGIVFIKLLYHDERLLLPGGVLMRIGMFGFVVAALYVAWRGRADDLVEDRRRLRDLLVWSIGIFALIIPTLEVFEHQGLVPREFVSFSAAGILVMSLVNSWFLVGLRDEDLLRRAAAVVAIATLPVDPDEPKMLADLRRLMEEERAYRDDGLGIGDVAARIGVPEYRLRRLINQRLGHRNFAAYLNGFRLAEVRAALADPAQREVPILTVALDAGFGSLAPFNRAFREAEGMTPTEYRQRALTGGAASAA